MLVGSCIVQGGNLFASSMQRGPFAGSAVARNPADGRQPGQLQYGAYPAVKQPGSIDMSPASSGIGMYICTVIHLQQGSVARKQQCAYSIFLIAHGVCFLVRGSSCVGLVMAEVCCSKNCSCIVHVWPAH